MSFNLSTINPSNPQSDHIAPKMSDIPSDLHREILCRLPAESVFRFRAVCKSWRRIIDHPSFVKSHNTNQSSSTLLIRDSVYCRLFMLPLDSIDAHPTVDLIRIKTLVRPNVPFLPHLPTTSCNGLILISHYNFAKTWVVWNPLTRECHELLDFFAFDLELEVDYELPSEGVGFGYESGDNDYKVVRIDRKFCDHKSKTHVYSLKSSSWKRISDCPRRLVPGRGEGVFLNGALHWVSVNEIVGLDLGTEDYHLLSLPPGYIDLDQPHLDLDGPMPLLDGLDLDGRTMPVLDALGGNLILSYHDIDFMSECFDVWMMKEYGVDTSWMKLFSFGEPDGIGNLRSLRPVAYLKSKGQVFLQHDDHFILVDLDKDSRKKVIIDGLPNEFSSQIFQGSLFRLDEGGSGGDVAADGTAGAKKKKRAGARFKLNVGFTDILHHSDSE